MSVLTQHFEALMATDWTTIIVISVLCAAAAWLIKEYLAHPPLILLVYPVLVVFSIVSSYIVSQFGLYNPIKLDQWLTFTVLSTMAGTMGGLALVATVNSIYAALTRPTPLR